MARHKWKAGDTEPIETVLRDRGRAIPLIGATVSFHAREVGAASAATETVACEVLEPPEEGRVQFRPPALFQTAGVYLSEWQIVFASGTPEERELTVPNGNDGDAYDQWEVLAELA